MTDGTRKIPGENRTAAFLRGVREFSGNTHANTISEHCIRRAMTKLEAVHTPAKVSFPSKFQNTRSFVVQRARKAMNAAKV